MSAVWIAQRALAHCPHNLFNRTNLRTDRMGRLNDGVPSSTDGTWLQYRRAWWTRLFAVCRPHILGLLTRDWADEIIPRNVELFATREVMRLKRYFLVKSVMGDPVS